MSRPLALLKTAALTNSRARQRHETLAAVITLVDRLVTDAGALRLLISPTSGASMRESLLHAADACARTRQALAERFEATRTDTALPGSFPVSLSAPQPLADMAHTLEQLAVVLRLGAPSAPTKETGPRLFLPDATTNPEYVQFATKGSVAALICYLCFVGFDYPGIYTSVITCFVVSLSTIGSSNQKGLLRFGGAAVGGVMGLVALVYLFPHVEGLGGFWLVFGTGTAVAAWINFGSPRISYGGYQTGLAFYKATLQGFGTAVSATVVRDRLIGVAFGLIVFGLVEHLLWPVRAADRMHARLADALRSLAALARVASRPPTGDVDARRQLISLQVADVQGFIESSKFEPGTDGADVETVERLTADTQTVFLVLVGIARGAVSAARPPDRVRAAMIRADQAAAAILEGVADRVRRSGETSTADLDGSVAIFDQSIAAQVGATEGDTTYAGAFALYRELAVTLNRLTSSERAIRPAALSPAAR